MWHYIRCLWLTHLHYDRNCHFHGLICGWVTTKWPHGVDICSEVRVNLLTAPFRVEQPLDVASDEDKSSVLGSASHSCRTLAHAGQGSPSSLSVTLCPDTEAGPENCSQQSKYPPPQGGACYIFGLHKPFSWGQDQSCIVNQLYLCILPHSLDCHVYISGLGVDGMVLTSIWRH